jgi:hypothetical protein
VVVFRWIPLFPSLPKVGNYNTGTFIDQSIVDKSSPLLKVIAGLQIEGVLAYLTHLKCPKRIGDDVGDFKYVKMTP